MLPYRIVVPSRKRSANMPTILRLLPTATICVDEREADDYAPHVPADQLLLHPPLEGFAVVVNWIIDAVAEPILVLCDDDLKGVISRMPPWRYIEDPDEILAIIENAAQCCEDLGLTTFAFSRTSNRAMIKPDETPIRPISYLSNVFGIMGKARTRKMDPRFAGRNAIDLTLKTLLEDRVIFGDCRFYFDCGAIFAGTGGNVGLVTKERFRESTLALVEAWGKHVKTNPLPFRKNFSVDAMRIGVSRSNAQGQK
jgi:hypothetical protein